MATQDDYIKTALRLPRELHQAIQESGEKNNRSMNAEIVARLEQSFIPGAGDIEGAFKLIEQKDDQLQQLKASLREHVEFLTQKAERLNELHENIDNRMSRLNELVKTADDRLSLSDAVLDYLSKSLKLNPEGVTFDIELDEEALNRGVIDGKVLQNNDEPARNDQKGSTHNKASTITKPKNTK